MLVISKLWAFRGFSLCRKHMFPGISIPHCVKLYCSTMLLRPLTVYSIVHVCTGLLRCSQVLHEPTPIFQLTRTCAMSEGLVTSDRLWTLEDCKQFAIENKGLALNFVDPKNLEDEEQANCLVYECPELDTSMLHDNSLYDYYSIYMDMDPESNVTCVPRLGMFKLVRERANWTEAQLACEWEGGQLAQVTSHERTTLLSHLVATLGPSKALHKAYVGLSDIKQEGVFVSVAGEPLNCWDFRSWAPGEPRSRHAVQDCVTLDSRHGWHVTDCAVRLPYICEVIAMPPNLCAHISSPRLKQKCIEDAEYEKNKQRKSYEKCKLYKEEYEEDN